MVRLFAVNLLFFLIPFIGYAAWLVVTRRPVSGAGIWPSRVILWLTVSGAVLMVAVLVIFTSFTGAPPGAVYVPATIVDGVLIPGHFE
jgi:hypothetical protein